MVAGLTLAYTALYRQLSSGGLRAPFLEALVQGFPACLLPPGRTQALNTEGSPLTSLA